MALRASAQIGTSVTHLPATSNAACFTQPAVPSRLTAQTLPQLSTRDPARDCLGQRIRTCVATYHLDDDVNVVCGPATAKALASDAVELRRNERADDGANAPLSSSLELFKADACSSHIQQAFAEC